MRLRVLPLLATSAAAVLAAGVVPAVAAPATPTATPAATAAIPDSSAVGTYYPDTPRRIFDSRGGGNSRLGQGRSVVITPSVSGVTPSAVVVNLTVVNPSTSGYLTAYPTGTALPRTSSINFSAGRTIANLVTVPVGSDGKIVIYNGLGTTDVLVDQLGAYSKNDDALAGRGRGGGYHPTDVSGLLDTRSDGGGPLLPGYYTTLAVRYNGTGSQISALAVNITVTNTNGNGYLTAYDGASSNPPRVSTLNFTKGLTVANSAIVPTSQCTTSACGGDAAQIGILNGSTGNFDVVVDITGFFDKGNIAAPVRYVPLASPVRIVDSRSNLGVGKLGAGVSRTFVPPASVAGASTVGLDTNVTLVKPTTSTYLTFWPQLTNYPRPNASTVNSGAGQVISNHAIQETGTDSKINVYNFNGTSDVVVDVSGTFQRIAGADARNAPTRAELAVVGPTASRQAAAR